MTAQDRPPPVDILGVRFERLTRRQAVDMLLERLAAEQPCGVCFPDMSTLNIAASDESFRGLLQFRMTVLNDGAGLAWAAWMRGRPFPANLNGTDLSPMLFDAVPVGTTTYVLGARPGRSDRAAAALAARHRALEVVGTHHGYLDAETERTVLEDLVRLRPRLVLVGMGNPRQIELITRHVDHPALRNTMWLAVGGLLDYHSGELLRAPSLVVRAHLEWLYLVKQQPDKRRRYLLGIPQFVARCLWAQLRGRHAQPAMQS